MHKISQCQCKPSSPSHGQLSEYRVPGVNNAPWESEHEEFNLSLCHYNWQRLSTKQRCRALQSSLNSTCMWLLCYPHSDPHTCPMSPPLAFLAFFVSLPLLPYLCTIQCWVGNSPLMLGGLTLSLSLPSFFVCSFFLVSRTFCRFLWFVWIHLLQDRDTCRSPPQTALLSKRQCRPVWSQRT
jgi:hypothetical protein